MVLVIDKKPMEGSWWKYGLLVSVIQMILWLLLGYKLNGELPMFLILTRSYVVYGTFIFFAFLPFAAARLGFKRLYWFALVGFILADAAYFLLSSFEPVRRLNVLLPFVGFIQVAAACLMLGVVVELGRYVYHKVMDR